ncbi:MAG TPA: hypothetical protein VEV87_08715, partial [Chitinophagaceae bacterium]|nr:hypothetical protein [Chitinophagaceae bacterium]
NIPGENRQRRQRELPTCLPDLDNSVTCRLFWVNKSKNQEPRYKNQIKKKKLKNIKNTLKDIKDIKVIRLARE